MVRAASFPPHLKKKKGNTDAQLREGWSPASEKVSTWQEFSEAISGKTKYTKYSTQMPVCFH